MSVCGKDESWETVKGQAGCGGAGGTWGWGGPALTGHDGWGGCLCRHCPHFRVSPQELSKMFTAIRKTKGDGNCFYRALGYAYLESLLGKSREILR